jgi:hypothetical protein
VPVQDTSGSTVIAGISGLARGSQVTVKSSNFFFFVMCVASLLEHSHPRSSTTINLAINAMLRRNARVGVSELGVDSLSKSDSGVHTV